MSESLAPLAEEFRTAYAKVRQEIHKVVVGHEDVVHGVLTCLFAGGHALLEGVPEGDKAGLVSLFDRFVAAMDASRDKLFPLAVAALVLGAAGDVEHGVADHAGQYAAHQGAGVARRVDVAVVEHGVAAAADTNVRRVIFFMGTTLP